MWPFWLSALSFVQKSFQAWALHCSPHRQTCMSKWHVFFSCSHLLVQEPVEGSRSDENLVQFVKAVLWKCYAFFKLWYLYIQATEMLHIFPLSVTRTSVYICCSLLLVSFAMGLWIYMVQLVLRRWCAYFWRLEVRTHL